eukprot:symbB.v1.2.023947.t2/scaffold2232.1/size85206/4
MEPPGELALGDVETLVVSCNKDGMDQLRNGELKAAFEQFKYAEAILMANQMEGDSTSLLATTCNNLGCYYKKVGKFHGALSYLRRALKLEVESATQEVTLAGTHLNLCAVLSKLEKHDKALQHALMALDLLNKRMSQEDIGAEADVYAILAIAYHNVGLEREYMEQWDQATIAFRSGYEVAKRFLGEGHALTLTLLNNSNAVLKKSKDLQEMPGSTGPPARSFKETQEKDEGVTLPPILPKKDTRSPNKRGNNEAADFLKSEELLWANFAAKTLRNTGPAIDEDLPSNEPNEEDVNDNDDAMARHPLNRAALVSMQDLGLILPQAYDQGLFRFQEPHRKPNPNILSKAMNDHPKSLMDIIDAEVDCEPSMSAPNDFRPNRAMKRSTRTSKVVRRTGVFNSTVYRDKVMKDSTRFVLGGRNATADTQNAAASTIQTTWRSWHKYLQDNSEWMTVTWICATMIQSHWRSYHVRRVKLDKMITNVQKVIRGVLVRRAMRQHRAAVLIQKRTVGMLTRWVTLDGRGNFDFQETQEEQNWREISSFRPRESSPLRRVVGNWMVRAGSQSVSTLTGPAAKSPTPSPESTEALNFMALHRNTDDPPQEGRVGRGVARSTPTTNKDRRTAVSPFRSLPELHPHEVELRVAVKDLSRDVAPEKFRSKAKSVPSSIGKF